MFKKINKNNFEMLVSHATMDRFLPRGKCTRTMIKHKEIAPILDSLDAQSPVCVVDPVTTCTDFSEDDATPEKDILVVKSEVLNPQETNIVFTESDICITSRVWSKQQIIDQASAKSSLVTIDHLKKLYLRELQTICANIGIPEDGQKKTVIERLIANIIKK
jgi:hypothetical protein